jgi:hypothetical protein
MHLKVELRDCIHGKGLFATGAIRPGDLIFYVNGSLVSYEDGLKLPCGGDHTVQIGPNLYVNPQFPSKYINHSCDPNAGIADDLRIIAIKPIERDEQVCFDYSTCVLERSWTMECACGSKNCRGIIGDFDGLPPALQKSYVEMGIVQPFIMEAVFKRRAAGRSLADTLPAAGQLRARVLFHQTPAGTRSRRALAPIA